MSHGINRQITAYLDERGLKHHQKEQISRIVQDWPEPPEKVLDIGCANGAMLKGLGSLYPKSYKHGIDLSPQLVKEATSRLGPGFSIEVADALEFEPKQKFNVIVASGVLSIFEDFTLPLKRWLSWLAKGGWLYIFGPFNSANVDTRILFRNNQRGSDWEGGLTSYAKTTVGNFLVETGFKLYDFKKFHMPEPLSKHTDPIRNYTLETSEGKLLLLNGANIISEYHFLSIFNG